ncbi:metallophosphatase domain-containing protein [Alloacidobacterium dinghuense]|uniref:Metallophosphatase domain-containing protein n=1 Tax=Alloacidobacterium dinghuense TaxID=2763107 RepID=A0A7G8BHR9_9BACT|nr:metallophosphatase domain-containing protein [Alloacidobacterium dinghuense]QNI32089.1 metallophosphatase domain-containing protein [Alloacidobacterium dinghuense]
MKVDQRKRKSSRLLGRKTNLQLVLLSDTHELHRELNVPSGDILIHAGDFTMFSRSLRSIIDFNEWLGELPHRWKVVIPGNHETFLQTNPANRSLVNNAAVLINEAVEIAGFRIWGSPVTPGFGPAFSVNSADERRLLYDTIPDNTDILITHGPPYGILDSGSDSQFHAGDRELFNAISRVKPRLSVFGHIHGCHGVIATEETIFANAALLGPLGDIDEEPIVLTIPQK